MGDFLSEKLIESIDGVKNWEEAIRYASKPLLREGYISEPYIESMINTVKELGPYIVLTDHVAVPHSRPDESVKRSGICLLRLKNPVNFKVNDEDEDNFVSLIFPLCAVDSSSHIEMLKKLSLILDDEKIIKDLIKAEDEDIMKLINKKMEEM